MEFNLSEKRINNGFVERYFNQPIYQEEFVKEFIRLLKEIPIIKQMGIGGEIITNQIDKLAGDKLR
jgi:hypothetical protein